MDDELLQEIVQIVTDACLMGRLSVDETEQWKDRVRLAFGGSSTANLEGKISLRFMFTQEALERLQEMQEQTNAPNRSTVIREALRRYDLELQKGVH